MTVTELFDQRPDNGKNLPITENFKLSHDEYAYLKEIAHDRQLSLDGAIRFLIKNGMKKLEE